MDHLEKVEIKNIQELRQWLAKNHPQTKAVWLITHKKSQADNYVPYTEIVDELLCWGWIDSTPRKLDEQRSMLLIANRKPKSRWSKVNKDKVARLTAEGRMQSPGIAKVELAQQTGTWDALNEVDQLIEPEDLLAQLKTHPIALSNWSNFPPSTRRGILEWILAAKTEETRSKRIHQTATLAEQNIRVNQPIKPRPTQADTP
jgi:uncharacterized protein YdeI (YjbR/CyaY-like superfamily)